MRWPEESVSIVKKWKLTKPWGSPTLRGWAEERESAKKAGNHGEGGTESSGFSDLLNYMTPRPPDKGDWYDHPPLLRWILMVLVKSQGLFLCLIISARPWPPITGPWGQFLCQITREALWTVMILCWPSEHHRVRTGSCLHRPQATLMTVAKVTALGLTAKEDPAATGRTESGYLKHT